MRDRLDKIGGWVLIYEGAVLASRRVRPEWRFPPAVSQMVWVLPKPARALTAAAVCGYLAWHFLDGPQIKSTPALARGLK